MKKIFKKLTATVLTAAMLFSSTIAFAEEAVQEEAASEIPRIIGSMEFEDESDKLLLYVAPNGDDKNEGTIESPLASMVGARNKIREIKKSGNVPENGIVVYFREGTYKIDSTISLTAEDSGTENARITYRNYPDETVDFVGAASLSWDDFYKVEDQEVLSKIVDEKARKKIYAANLKELGFTDLKEPIWPGPYSYWGDLMKHLTPKYGIEKPKRGASELIINGKSMTLARYPNDGYMIISEVVESGWNPGSLMQDGNQTMPDDAKPTEVIVADKRVQNWVGVEGAIMYGTFFYTWASHGTEIDKINPKTNSIKAKYPMWYPSAKGQSFYVLNLIEEIDMPGEYYIDTKDGILYIMEPEEEVKEVAYTTLEDTMLMWDGADYVTVKNINMKYMKHSAFQMNNGSENCELIGSEISYASYYNYVFGKNNKVLDCYVHDNGYGIELAGGDRPTLTRSNNLLENSVFHNNDRVSSTYSPSVALTRCGNSVRYCDIYGAQHELISYSGNYQELSYCDIWGACTHADDMGAIYAGRDITQRGNKITYNYIHDIGGGTGVGSNGCHGIFLDDWWSAADIAGNVFANIPDGAAVMLAGSYNVMDNNILVNCKESFRLTRSFNYGNPDNFTVYHDKAKNIPYTSELWKNAFPGIENIFAEDGAPDMNNYIVCTDNVLYNAPLPTTSEQVAKTATVKKNVTFTKDPGFYDMENANYLLKEDSSVYDKIPGFMPIPFTRIGAYSERAMQRIKEAYVFSLNTPYAFKNGKKIKNDKESAIALNGTMYVPVRFGADAVGAKVEFDQATEMVNISNKNTTVEFKDGAKALKVNGSDYALKNPVVNKNDTNYISIEDLANIFEKHLVTYNNMAVISDMEELFRERSDSGLMRYIEEQLSVY